MSPVSARLHTWLHTAVQTLSTTATRRARTPGTTPLTVTLDPAEPTAADDHWLLIAGQLCSALYVWVAIWLTLAVIVPFLLLRWEPVVITSGSMTPLIGAGDIVLNSDADHPVTPGHVITFHDPAHDGVLNTHRVVSALPEGTYRTRGDANPTIDSTPVPADAIVGRGRLLVPLLGLPLIWLSDNLALFAIWAALTASALAVMTPRRHPPNAHGRHTRRRSRHPTLGAGLPPTTTAIVVTLTIALTATTIVVRSSAALTATTSNAANTYAAAPPLVAPSNLTATPTCNGTTSEIGLSWTATPSTTADGYELTRTPGGATTIPDRTTTAYNDTPVTDGQAYDYELRATQGPWTSAAATVSTTASTCPPYVAASSSGQGSGGSLDLARPAGTQVGDVLIAQTSFIGGANQSAPAGWTFLTSRSAPDGNPRTYLWWRVAAAGDPASWTFTQATGAGAGGIVAVRGANTATPVDVLDSSAGESTSMAVGSVTTTVPALLLGMWGVNTGPSVSTPGAMTTEYNERDAGIITAVAASEPWLTAGTTGTRTATIGDDHTWVGFLLAIRD